MFFSGCSLKCVYCQNHEISTGNFGIEVTPERLVEIMLELQDQGALNINLVTATHFAHLLPEALEMARMGVIPAGAYRNADHFGAGVAFDDDVENGMEDVLFDPQTSGGLLFALPPADAETLLARLQDAGVPAALVGSLSPYEGHHVHVRA